MVVTGMWFGLYVPLQKFVGQRIKVDYAHFRAWYYLKVWSGRVIMRDDFDILRLYRSDRGLVGTNGKTYLANCFLCA